MFSFWIGTSNFFIVYVRDAWYFVHRDISYRYVLWIGYISVIFPSFKKSILPTVSSVLLDRFTLTFVLYKSTLFYVSMLSLEATMKENIRYLSFWDWLKLLIWLSTTASILSVGNIAVSLWLKQFSSYIPWSLKLIITWLSQWCCTNMHWSTNISVIVCLQFLWINISLYGRSTFSFYPLRTTYTDSTVVD